MIFKSYERDVSITHRKCAISLVFHIETIDIQTVYKLGLLSQLNIPVNIGIRLQIAFRNAHIFQLSFFTHTRVDLDWRFANQSIRDVIQMLMKFVSGEVGGAVKEIVRNNINFDGVVVLECLEMPLIFCVFVYMLVLEVLVHFCHL